MPPEVTICIPTYESAPFIARTIGFATGQTHSNIRILISVDLSTDQTVPICRDIAAKDPRIVVHAHKERVGWAENVAGLIRRVDTPYFFVYFHDDFVSPHYCQRMVQAIQTEQGAASAHCSVDFIGRSQRHMPAHSYDADPVHRILTMLSHDQVPGAPLRSMIRTDAFDLANLLRPGIGPGESFQAYGLHTAVLLAGPVVGVEEVLYTRWIRENSLISSDKNPTCAQLRDVWLNNLERLWPYLEGHFDDPDALSLVKHTFLLRAVWQILGASDASKAGLQEIWRRCPALPQVEDLPSAAGLHSGLAETTRKFQTRVSTRIDQLS